MSAETLSLPVALPRIPTGSAGQVLKFTSTGELKAEDPLPTGTTGQILAFDSSGELKAVDIVASLPSGSAGQVLTFGSSGELKVTDPASGGGFTDDNITLTHTGNTAISTDKTTTIMNYSMKPGWIARVSTNNGGRSGGIAVCSNGVVFVSGIYSASTSYNADGTSFGSALSGASLTTNITKYNKQGTVLWNAHVYNTGSETYTDRVTVDASDNIYYTYFGAGTFTAKNANGTTFGTTYATTGDWDVGIVSYDTNGSVRWITRYGSTAQDYSGALAIYGNSLYSAASTTATFTPRSFDNTTFGSALTNEGGGFVPLIKFNTSGVVQWATKIQTNGDAVEVNSIAADKYGFYVSYCFTGTTATLYHVVNGSSVSSTKTTTNTQWNNNIWWGNKGNGLAKYSHDGYLLWNTRIQGTAGATTGSHTTAYFSVYNGELYMFVNYANTNNDVYDAGNVYFATLVGGTGDNVALVKYNSYGKCQFAHVIGTPGMVLNSIKVNAFGIFIAGTFTASSITIKNFDGSTYNTYSKTGGATSNVITICYNHAGSVQFATTINGSGAQAIIGMDVDNSDIYLNCSYEANPISVSYPSGQNTLTATKTYTKDNLVVKYAITGLASLANPASNMQKTISFISSEKNSCAKITLASSAKHDGNVYNAIYLQNTGSSITMTWNGTNWLTNGGVSFTMLA